MKEQFKNINFSDKSLDLIFDVNEVIADYKAQGYNLTLRQVYYQLVSRNIIENKERSYKNLGVLINNARLAGYIDWNAIEDRTRYMRGNSHWKTPKQILRAAINSYYLNRWEAQDYYVEVWVEKDALIDIVGQICERLDVNHFSCRGYVSQSEMYGAAKRLIEQQENGKEIVILHLGDHDPSGIDMTRDIEERLTMFGVYFTEFERIALTREQIDKYNPPPNPAKLSDSRARGYISRHGYSSWELDALNPEVLTELIHRNVFNYMDADEVERVMKKEEKDKEDVELIARNYDDIIETIRGKS